MQWAGGTIFATILQYFSLILASGLGWRTWALLVQSIILFPKGNRQWRTSQVVHEDCHPLLLFVSDIWYLVDFWRFTWTKLLQKCVGSHLQGCWTGETTTQWNVTGYDCIKARKGASYRETERGTIKLSKTVIKIQDFPISTSYS